MGAYVDHKFDQGFFLDEERLRKLHDLIASRLAKFERPLTPSYKVFRGDSYSYETDSVGDVAKEDNEDWRAIARLEVVAHDPDVFDFKLSFSDKGLVAEISGDDRDSVFLLFSDLKSYIQDQVLVGRGLSRDVARGITMLLMFITMAGFLFFGLRNLGADPDSAQAALDSHDVAEKLDYLIEARSGDKPRASSYGWLFAMMALSVLGISGALEAAWRIAFPSNVFLFGARKVAFERRRAFLGRIFWVVIVGLGVSAAAGLLVWWLTKR
jgi:hypothetical protein